MVAYNYTDLQKDEIRVIRLLPGEFDDDICFTIEHVPLVPKQLLSQSQIQAVQKLELEKSLPDGWKVFVTPEGKPFFWSGVGYEIQYEHPRPDVNMDLYNGSIEDAQTIQDIEYEALSYVWGPPDILEPVFIYSGAGSSQACNEHVPFMMEARRNLVDALRHLRLVDQPRILWVDAICINQNNIAERNQQVSRMGMIYSQAKRVIAWLGVCILGSGQAIAALRSLASLVEISSDMWIFRSTTNNIKGWRPWIDKIPFDDETWAKLDTIFSLPYFERLWIIQELRLANQRSLMQCGNNTIPLPEFRRAVFALTEAKDISQSSRTLVSQVEFLMRPQTKIFELLRLGRICQCSDMRDKIYGLLSIVPPQLAARIKPNYALPPQDVYKDFCLSFIDVTKRLDLLTLCVLDDTRKVNSNLPSWSVDLSANSSVILFDTLQAAVKSRSEYTYVPPAQLTVTGIPYARVVATSDPMPPDLELAAELLSKHRPRDLSTGAYPNEESILDSWIRLLTLDRLRDRCPRSPQLPLLQDLRKNWADAIAQARTPLEITIVPPSWLNTMQGGAALIELENGYRGIAPPTARPGDCAVVLLGCYIPMILRPQMNGKYIVIGRCYIQGLMNGEALLGDLITPWSVQTYPENGLNVHKYYNSETGILTNEDPRLPPLGRDWKAIYKEPSSDDPLDVAYFEHIPTGEVINSDPRLLPDALRSRGVQLQKLELV